jgi:3-isopropylmalate/(R)-2-methylmalate dehydratase large subunit
MKKNMTMAEKILARASGKTSVSPNDFVIAKVDLAMMPAGPTNAIKRLVKSGISEADIKIWDPEKFIGGIDHAAPPASEAFAETQKQFRESARKYGMKYFYDVYAGICHQVIHEKGHIVPGMLILGQDSHTTTYGALNVAATGIGISETAYVMMTGELWFRVPETIKIEVIGKLSEFVYSKDIVLEVAGKYGSDVAQYKAIEWLGSAIECVSLDGRFTMGNMSVELGAKFGIFRADQKTLDYVRSRTDKKFEVVEPDPDANYAQTILIDGSKLEPKVALPHNVGNVVNAREAREITIDQAQIGSCCNGRIEDLETAARIIKGKKVAPGVRFYVAAASWELYREAIERGIISTLLDSGAMVLEPYCGICTGFSANLAAGERCISATTRNFKGRMGSPKAEIYLGSPATVTASAITGRITDPREVA